MIKSKCLGIWMDHASANLMEFNEAVESTIIKLDFSQQDKKESLEKGEKLMHNKEQQHQATFYKKLAAAILNYDKVLVFGPTDAGSELQNILKDDLHFEKIKIEVQKADKMTENQQHAFVKDYFSNN